MANKNISQTSSIYNRVTFGFSLLLILAIFMSQMAVQVADDEFERDLRNWEIRLGIVADTRAELVEGWVEQQKSEMQAIADNITVQIFMSEHDLKEDKSIVSDSDEGQLGFIRNYLVATAHRAGFAARLPVGDVAANLPVNGDAGIVLLDNQANALVVTQGMPKLKLFDDKAEKTAFMQKVFSGKVAMKDIYLSSDKKPLIAFSAPIFAVQGEKQVGAVVAIKPVAGLYEILNKSRIMEKSAETMLVRSNDGLTTQYISPLANKTPPLKLSLGVDKHRKLPLAGEYAINNIGKFVIANDYDSQEVIVTSRKITNTPWVLVHKVNRDEALAESDKRRASIIAISLLVISLLVIVIIAVWRHSSSIKYKNLAEKFSSQERLLRLVSDNQPDPMYIIDKNQKYCFSNLSASKDVNMDSDEMVGKTMRSVVGAIKADQCAAITEHISKKDGVISHIARLAEDGDNAFKVVQSKYIALQRVPRILTGEVTAGALVVEQDITKAIAEKEKRERLLDGLVDTLVSVVDRRDKFSADHSKRVAMLAQAVANEMNLDEVTVETATIAAKLMNLGKIIMPRELLAKTGKFTAKEKKMITEARKASAEFIHGLEFDGAVEETLLQVREHWDGSGDLGLKGNDSLVTARIVAISNEYVAMTSPRAYRDAYDSEEAINILMGEVGKRYERKLVVALVNYIENNQQSEAA